MKKIGATLLMAAFIALLATTAFARPADRWQGRDHRCRGDINYFSKYLNLTPEQTAEIRSLQENHWKDVKPLRDKMFAKRGDLRLAWLEKNPQQEKIVSLQREIRALRGQMQDKSTEFKFAVAKILTPEQKSKLENSSRRGEFRRHGYGPMKKMGGPCSYGPARGMRGNW